MVANGLETVTLALKVLSVEADRGCWYGDSKVVAVIDDTVTVLPVTSFDKPVERLGNGTSVARYGEC